MTLTFGPPGWPRSASTSTSTVTEVLPTRFVWVKKLTRSPTKTGAWKTTSRIATVTIRPGQVRWASTAPAWSM